MRMIRRISNLNTNDTCSNLSSFFQSRIANDNLLLYTIVTCEHSFVKSDRRSMAHEALLVRSFSTRARFITVCILAIVTITFYLHQSDKKENGQLSQYFKTFSHTKANERSMEHRYWKSTSFSGATKLPHSPLPYNIPSFSYKFWKSIKPSFTCPPNFLQRLGREDDGGKWTCGINYLKTSSDVCTLYSFGISSESSFEADVLRVNSKCRIFAYDPTVNGMGAPFKGPDPRVKFQKLGLDSMAGTKLRKQMQTLKFIMNQNGHDWIDILKVDIEGWEYTAFDKVFEDFDGPLPFGQLQIELHSSQSYNKFQTNMTLKLIHQLQERGLRLFYYEPNEIDPFCCGEYAFINIRSLPLFLDLETISKLVK